MADAAAARSGAGPRWKQVLFYAFLAFWFVAFLALGTWQVHRRTWKLNLIATTNARVHAPPVPAPGPADWSPRAIAREIYLHVRVHGHYLNDRETLTQAVAAEGPGSWVMTPLVTDRGFTVLVNRGFVPSDRAAVATRQRGQLGGEVTVTGLLRPTEPKGGFLQSNDPATNSWHSRDVAAIASARDLHDVAPYFIDADATPNPGGWPSGGRTVVQFYNEHLVYAITWYGMAVLVLVCAVVVVRAERAKRRAA